MIYQREIELRTSGHRDMHDVTREVAGIVAASEVRSGLVHVFNVGSTAALGTIEFEPGLERDLPEALDRLIPSSREYGHELAWHDGNGHSHLQATLLGPSLTVPVRDGKGRLPKSVSARCRLCIAHYADCRVMPTGCCPWARVAMVGRSYAA